MNKKNRFFGLELLRFSLGFFIMVYHTAHNYPSITHIPWLRNVTSMGFFATSTFFVLSGFLLAHVYFNQNQMRESARSFWIKRFCNLYPIHIVALISSVLVLILMHWLSIPPDGPGASPRFVVYDTHEIIADRSLIEHYMDNSELIINSFLQLFMLQAWNPMYLTFNAPLWSLSTLFFFYLIFPFITPRLLNIKSTKSAIALTCFISLVPPLFVIFNSLWGMPWTGLLQRFPLFRLPEFICGILCYSLFRQHQQRKYRIEFVRCCVLSLFIFSCFILAAWLYTQRPERFWYPLLHNGLLLPSQLTLLYLCALLPEPRSDLLRSYLPRMGAASLSIFALHVPLFYLWSTFEPLLRSIFSDWRGGWDEWVFRAGGIQLSLSGYALFLVLTVWICLNFQEQVVVRIKKILLNRLL
ncbi:Peptidoglycan/LPS O-acetylase OafA/YrhL, contains acyltransferase and SGNH-hydrolase domains [Rosenbergiella nectarea]|uniref:Peptidoglycan/LPS O-acetylase OafA/YrhL, contains acyltransferase and SGNH-hydrolase domains n=1 Tax=Rosenbergiella nectarea TaxID=988801 RepID=A0A1H9KCF0_9GAMM|nr:acyltransferase [Rosenbergiella nectarea]SEQ96840.1 Peptidoglycan/LPS O-acetylase OafA/YrhL, contains acyltransferase and SGNH-hydrolase domains [Rosenbergiella nectarea]